MTKRHLAELAAVVAAATVTTIAARQLEAHHVSLPLLVAACAAIFSTTLNVLAWAARSGSTTTHRCTTPGCDFTARLQGHDAGDNRRWQEIAANHPTHI